MECEKMHGMNNIKFNCLHPVEKQIEA